MIAITGHTKGFGKVLFDRTQSIGFSRSNGYDITNKKDRARIINEINSCDVFINNAYDGYGQIDMLYDVYDAWKNTNKTIISVGSLASNGAEWMLEPMKYAVIKKALDVATWQLVNSHHRKCRVSIFKPGFFEGNPAVYDIYSTIKHEDAVDCLLGMINSKTETVEIVIRS